MRTTSLTVAGKSQSTLARCGTYEILCLVLLSGFPKKCTCPETMGIMPIDAFNSVDLPALFGPMIAVKVLEPTFISIEYIAGSEP